MSPTERYHAIEENDHQRRKWLEAKSVLEVEVSTKLALLKECNQELARLRKERDDIDQYKLPL